MKRTALILTLIVFTALLFLALIAFQVTNWVTAQAYSTIAIKPDGSIDGTDKIQRDENICTFAGDISGNIQIRKSNIVIDGAGYSLIGNGGTGIDLTNNITQVPSSLELYNVTIKNLRILDFNFSVKVSGGGSYTFVNNYVGRTSGNYTGGVYFFATHGSSFGSNVTHCTITGSPAAIQMELSSGNSITENNLNGGVLLQLGGSENVDRNYWYDYQIKYPNATEVDSTGTWNIPYKFDTYGAVVGELQDNHPLMNPVSVTIPEFPSWIVLPLLIVMVTAVAFIVYFKKRKH